MMKKIAALFLCGLAVSSCTTTRESYETVSTALAGSKSLRRASIQNCTINARHNSAYARHNVALLMDVKDSQVDHLACARLVNSVASGRLTYDEIMSMRYGRLTPNFIRIMQGR